MSAYLLKFEYFQKIGIIHVDFMQSIATIEGCYQTQSLFLQNDRSLSLANGLLFLKLIFNYE